MNGAPGRSAAAAPRDRPGARPRLRIRARLTLTYAGLVTASGVVLIALVYLYTRFVPLHLQLDLPSGGDGAATSVDIEIEAVAELLRTLLLISTGVLLLLALASAAVGWLVAGRILAPLAAMNTAANRAASGDLSQRLALGGPRDEVRDLAATFDRMLDSLEGSLAAHRRFAANASHELRTPLATTQTMIDVALADPGASVGSLRSLAERLREINRSNTETVDALLDLADAQSGVLSLQDVDLGEVVRTELAAVAEEAGRRGVLLRAGTTSAEVPAQVPGDPVLLRQAVSNLLRNAVRYNVEAGVVQVHLARTGTTVGLTVRNDGPLVPADRLASLTEPFVRGEGRGRTRESGHGLGLPIVSAVASAHAGRLRLSANPTGGLTVVLELPLSRERT